MKHIVSIVFVLVIVALLSVGNVNAQDQAGTPTISYPIKMYPGSISVYMFGGNLENKGSQVHQDGLASSEEGFVSNPKGNQLVFSWRTNGSDIWRIEIFVNYTSIVQQTVKITHYGGDMLGNPLGDEPEWSIIGNKIWIRLTVVTTMFPRPPTLLEQVQWAMSPSNPLITVYNNIVEVLADVNFRMMIIMALLGLDIFSRGARTLLRFAMRLIRGG